MQERIYRNWSWLTMLLIVTGTVMVYIGAISAPLVFDDQFTILSNPGISAFDYLLSAHGWIELWKYADAIFEKNIFRPVLFISLALNNHFGGGTPELFRAFNYLLHAFNAVLVFAACRRGFEGLRPDYGSLAPVYAAAFVAAVFAVHPVQSEPAIYITARSSSLAFLFMMLSWLTIERLLVREALGEKPRWTDPLQYVLAALLALVGLLSKETAVVLPVLLLLYDRWIVTPAANRLAEGGKTRTPGESILFLLPFFLAAGVFAVFRISVLGRSEGFEVRPGEFSILATNLKSYWHYFWLWLAPVHLAIDHDFAYEIRFLNPRTILAATGLALLGGLAWRRRHKSPVTAIAVFGAIVTLMPTNLITPLKDILVENRMYAGTVFVGLLLVQAARFFWEVGKTGERVLVATAALLLLGTWTARIQARIADWSSPVTLWEAEAMVSPGKSRVQYNLGVAYALAGREDDAVKAYVKAVEADQMNYEARLNIASLSISQAFNQTLWDRTSVDQMNRNLQVARTELKFLSEHSPKRFEALYNLADSYRLEREPREALYFAREAFRADSARPEIYELMGRIYEMYAIDPAVIRDFNPALWESRNDWLDERHRLEEDYVRYYELAFRCYSLALDYGAPNQVEVLRLQTRAKLRTGDPEEAERLGYRVVNAAANDPMAHFELARILELRNRPDLAKDYYRTAIQLDPSFAQAHVRLARLLEKEEDYAGASSHFQIAQNFDDRYKKDFLDFQKHLADLGIELAPKFRPPK